MIPDVMTRAERIASYAKRQPHAETHHLTLAECAVCGWLDWISSAPAESPGVSVERMEPGRCPSCASVQMRSPEVYNWVLSVLVQHEQGGGHHAASLPHPLP